MYDKLTVFAHRGASGYCFENTFEAFELAKSLGADGIEIDIQQSSDYEYFVVHDNLLTRIAGVKKYVNKLTADELKKIRIGKKFSRFFSKTKIPLLDDVIQWAIQNKMPLNIELKETLLDNIPHFKETIRHLHLPTGSYISSFHNKLLEITKCERPNVETALIITKKTSIQNALNCQHIDNIHANKKYYSPHFLDTISASNKKVRFYNIDGSENFLHNPHPVVIGWITDYPDIVKRKMNKQKA